MNFTGDPERSTSKTNVSRIRILSVSKLHKADEIEIENDFGRRGKTHTIPSPLRWELDALCERYIAENFSSARTSERFNTEDSDVVTTPSNDEDVKVLEVVVNRLLSPDIRRLSRRGNGPSGQQNSSLKKEKKADFIETYNEPFLTINHAEFCTLQNNEVVNKKKTDSLSKVRPRNGFEICVLKRTPSKPKKTTKKKTNKDFPCKRLAAASKRFLSVGKECAKPILEKQERPQPDQNTSMIRKNSIAHTKTQELTNFQRNSNPTPSCSLGAMPEQLTNDIQLRCEFSSELQPETLMTDHIHQHGNPPHSCPAQKPLCPRRRRWHQFCRFCDLTFSPNTTENSKSYVTVFKEAKRGTPKYQCDICNSQFTNYKLISKHIKAHVHELIH